MSDDSCQVCLPPCPSVFDRVMVSYLIQQGTKVFWELLNTFNDPLPYTFQLQFGTTSNPNADDWLNVGGSLENVYCTVDPLQRVFGKVNWGYYRVVLTTSKGIYYSLPINALGTLGFRDWVLARNVIRNRLLRYRLGEGQAGALLKRRVTGEPCPFCLDLQTQECTDPQCPSCYSTGRRCGYFFPMDCIWVKTLTPRADRVAQDPALTEGTTDKVAISAEMLGTEVLTEDDVWVNYLTDDRYYVHVVRNTAEWRGVRLVTTVELRPIEFTSPIYRIPIPAQLAAASCLPH